MRRSGMRGSWRHATRASMLTASRYPARRRRQRPQFPQHAEVRKHQLLPEALEHTHSVIPMAEVAGGHVQQRAHMATEALRRAELQVVRNIGDGEAGVLEQARSADQA